MSDLEPETLEETKARLAGVGVPAPVANRAPGRGRRVVAVAIAVALALGVVGVSVFALVGPAAVDWSAYPGDAYSDADQVLASDSLETVVARAEATSAQFRDALTEEFGMTWTHVYDPTLARSANYYGGESLLYLWDAGNWQGQATISDPGARQRIQDLFQSVTAASGATGFTSWNELSPAGDPLTLEQYGLGEKSDQALWSMGSHEPKGVIFYTADVFDRTIPVGDTFVADQQWEITDATTDTLFVNLVVSAPNLLSEKDRAEFITRLEPFRGLDKPAPTD